MLKLSLVLCVALFGMYANAGAVGGIGKPITDEQELKELAGTVTDHLQKLGAKANGPQIGFVKINSAAAQPVAGILYHISATLNENSQEVDCSIKLWVKEWEKFSQFDVECGEDKHTYQWKSTKDQVKRAADDKEDGPLLGGFSSLSQKKLDELHPKVHVSFVQLGEKHDDFDLTLKKLVSGKSQVVAGTKYVLTLNAENEKKESKTCTAQIWEQSWTNLFEVTLNCDEKKYKIEADLPKE